MTKRIRRWTLVVPQGDADRQRTMPWRESGRSGAAERTANEPRLRRSLGRRRTDSEPSIDRVS